MTRETLVKLSNTAGAPVWISPWAVGAIDTQGDLTAIHMIRGGTPQHVKEPVEEVVRMFNTALAADDG